ncbi:SH3 domain-containing protein [Trichostrongylus colubriformis]|uniref:SH3 domain-containing protein n=1 Tax=Trichostrongylus colubriformis TaxID=6319 RepID=A0AAN8G3L6_TRICO
MRLTAVHEALACSGNYVIFSCNFIKALFDYDHTREVGVPHRSISIQYGDILHVMNTSDDDWWTAKKLLPSLPPEHAQQAMNAMERAKQSVVGTNSSSLRSPVAKRGRFGSNCDERDVGERTFMNETVLLNVERLHEQIAAL